MKEEAQKVIFRKKKWKNRINKLNRKKNLRKQDKKAMGNQREIKEFRKVIQES